MVRVWIFFRAVCDWAVLCFARAWWDAARQAPLASATALNTHPTQRPTAKNCHPLGALQGGVLGDTLSPMVALERVPFRQSILLQLNIHFVS
jgi:hypothetical protein